MTLIKNQIIYLNALEEDMPNKELIKIFSKPIAKTIWAAYTQCHISSQYTMPKILELADQLEKEGIPKTSKDLLSKLHPLLRNNKEIEFATELLPYLKGEKEFEYMGLSLC